MNVVDLPQPATHALYDDAITRYAELVQSRSISVYRVGRVRYPGLSGIELLVVTDRTGIDNRYFFSAVQRLPRRFHSLFIHEPFILPAWSLRVIQYTPHALPALLAGRDVLHPYSPIQTPDERWCRLLEAYCSYSAFMQRTISSEIIEGRLTMSAAAAFSHVLTDAAYHFPQIDANAYAYAIDAIRSDFFKTDTPAAGVQAVWKLLSEDFDRLDRQLRKWLGAESMQEAVAKARVLLRGEEPCDALDREYAFRRSQDIDGYHQELASLGFPYGHLFFVAAHPGAVRELPDAPVVTNLVRNFYRVRRRLAEYAAGA